MMKKALSDDLRQSLLEAGAIARGEAKPSRRFAVGAPDSCRPKGAKKQKPNLQKELSQDSAEAFTAAERNLIRLEFMDRMGGARSLDEGIFLYRWIGGPNKGQPKLNKAVQSLLARGLIEIVDPKRGLPFARFTPFGFKALKVMAKNKNKLRPDRHQHLLEELQTK
jgi:hypothetical protein